MANFDAVSKITSKNQTTIPASVRKVLGLGEGDRIRFQVLEDGRVELSKDAAVASDDRAVAAYLQFLEQDMVERPAKLAPLERDAESQKLFSDVDLSGWLDEDQLR